MPIYLYRLNLGWLFGHRALLLIHQGRRSGLLRETVLEVILYDPTKRESVVLSAWGEKADRYRNIAATPALEVRTGGQRYAPEQRFLAPEENHAVLGDYGRRHPIAFRIFARAFGYPLGGTEAECRRFAESLRLVAFRPRDVESYSTDELLSTLFLRASVNKRYRKLATCRHSSVGVSATRPWSW